jgi:spore coat protein H
VLAMREWRKVCLLVLWGTLLATAGCQSSTGAAVAADRARAEQAPVEQAPAEQAPVEQAPAEQAPVEQAPAAHSSRPAGSAAAPPHEEYFVWQNPSQPDASRELFEKGHIPELRIRVSDKEYQQLRGDPRNYVDCTLIENGRETYKKVKIKLKGAAGSFRNVDDRPALTVKMKKDERFYGLVKFHLNNSVQDESYLNEWLSWQLCREAGYPATRVTHARVWLNDRDLGFYVLKEGFDELFVSRHFPNPKGNLYDGGFCQDIDANLEKDAGEGLDDRSDLKAIIAACREGDREKRKAAVAQTVDVDAFLKFTALELMMCHWDGYCQNRNNYRVYIRADNKKAVFFLHGMDQMFGDPNFSVFHTPGAMVARAIHEDPEWKLKYRQTVRQLLPLFTAQNLHAKVDAAHARIRPVVAKMNEDRARHLDGRVQDFKNRLTNRHGNIRAQFPPEPIAFNAQGYSQIEDWAPKQEGDAKLEMRVEAGRNCLVVETGPSNRSVASFRTKVRLARGSYRLEAKVRTVNVAGTNEDIGSGAGVRISGGRRGSEGNAEGTRDWQTVTYNFDINDELREVELVAELRATSGLAAFDVGSLRVYKTK